MRLGALLAAGAVVLAALAVARAALPDHSSGRPLGVAPRVFVFVSSVGGRELGRLERFGARIDVAAPNWYTLDAASGRIAAPDPRSVARLLTVTRARGVQVWPVVNVRTGGSRAWEPAAAQARIARSLEVAALGEGAAGVTLDMEELTAPERGAFSALVGAAAQRLHAAGRQLAVYVPRPGPGGAAAYDWAALAARADLVLTAGYNEHWSGGAPGPITTTAGFAAVVDRGRQLVGTAKAVPLLGAFGYRWAAPGRGALLSTIDADRLRRRSGARSYSADGATGFRVGGDTVSYETTTGLRGRAALARAHGARWIGLFSLGREPIAFWRDFVTHRMAVQADAPGSAP